MSEWNRQLIGEFRANEGTVTGSFADQSLLLLTTVGFATGRRHTTPLLYLRDHGRYVVFASNAGSDHHPHWYRNLVAEPRVTVEVAGLGGVTTLPMLARVIEGQERDRFCADQVRAYPRFGEYERRASRQIPVIALRPASAHDAEAVLRRSVDVAARA